MVFDGTYIYAFQGVTSNFYRYDISLNSWTSKASTPGNIAPDGALTYDGTYIYAFQGNSTSFWRYNIGTDSWTSMTNALGIVATGSDLAAALGNVGIPVFSLGTTSTRCQGVGTVTYTATSTNSTGISYSLDATSLASGNTINTSTGAVTYTTGWNGTSTVTASATGYFGPKTSQHTVTINSTPTITVTPASRCGTGTVTLGASVSAGTINWYAALTGGTSLGTGTSYTTPTISSTTTYYVDTTNNGCTSTPRTVVTATITKNNWNGSSTDWNDPANWCSGIPTQGVAGTLDVLIPSGLAKYPIIQAGDAAGYVKTIVLENNTTLTIMDNSLRITDNLKLDGKIDLEGESQLLQDLGSTLDPTSAGTLERDQQGIADTYTYNYWSSPVSKINTSSNNVDYKVTDVFTGVNFLTSGYNGSSGSPIGIADYWIWKFSNLQSNNYSLWQHVRRTGTLLVGEGFSMKGPGTESISPQQNYVLLGKPNNGDINLNITAGNDYLIGNPYPSSIDADQFITDNDVVVGGTAGSSTGTLYFWQHWGGGSHYLKDYQGGYATYTLAGGTPAPSLGNPPPGLIKRPGRYIPVAQGFFVTAETSGTIKFNNGQRAFQIEGTNSVFVKSGSTKNSKSSNNTNQDVREKLRLGFNSVNKIHRQLLATVDPKATIGYDKGYDAKNIDNQIDDMYWLIDTAKYIIQGVDNINNQTVFPLGIHTKNSGINTILIDELENFTSSLNIYIHDKALNLYHNLKQSNYDVYLQAGAYLNRFEITFSNSLEQTALSIDHIKNDSVSVIYSNEKSSIIIQNPNLQIINSAELFNTLGQSLYKFETDTKENYITYKTKHISSGTYIIKLKTDSRMVSKKVLIK